MIEHLGSPLPAQLAHATLTCGADLLGRDICSSLPATGELGQPLPAVVIPHLTDTYGCTHSASLSPPGHTCCEMQMLHCTGNAITCVNIAASTVAKFVLKDSAAGL